MHRFGPFLQPRHSRMLAYLEPILLDVLVKQNSAEGAGLQARLNARQF